MIIAFLDTRWFHILMTPMKVLYIVPTVGIGGVETFIKNVSISHSAQIIPSFLLFRPGPLGQWLESKKLPVYYCSQPPRLSKPLSWLQYSMELLKLVKQHRFQIIHSSMAYAALFSWPASFYARHVWFQHGPVSGWMDWLAHQLPNKIIYYNSNHTRQKQAQLHLFPLNMDKNIVVPLGTPFVFSNQARDLKKKLLANYNLPQNTIVLCMANRLQRWKGVHIAIDAYRKLLQKTNKSTVFFIYGDDTWDKKYKKELESSADQLPIHFLPPTDNISDAFLTSDIVLNCSITPEPFGLTLIEAMSCGAIAMAANNGGGAEILSPELTECLFSPNNSQELCDAIFRVIENNDLLADLKKRCFKKFNDHYTLEKMMKNLEVTYLK